MRLHAIGFARAGCTAADINSGDECLFEYDGRNPGGLSGVISISDKHAGDIGDEISQFCHGKSSI